MDEESTSEVEVLSYAVAWQLGPRSGQRPYRHVHPNYMFHVGPKHQSSTRLESNSFVWWQA
jgi:hypothetical protein